MPKPGFNNGNDQQPISVINTHLFILEKNSGFWKTTIQRFFHLTDNQLSMPIGMLLA
jgi:hypothetical protein